jgi:hypothetical protein
MMHDLKALSATLRPPKPCSATEKRQLLVGAAKAGLAARTAEDHVLRMSQEVRIALFAVARSQPHRLPGRMGGSGGK